MIEALVLGVAGIVAYGILRFFFNNPFLLFGGLLAGLVYKRVLFTGELQVDLAIIGGLVLVYTFFRTSIFHSEMEGKERQLMGMAREHSRRFASSKNAQQLASRVTSCVGGGCIREGVDGGYNDGIDGGDICCVLLGMGLKWLAGILKDVGISPEERHSREQIHKLYREIEEKRGEKNVAIFLFLILCLGLLWYSYSLPPVG